MKQIIRLTETDLHKLVKESVQQILKEHEWWREEDFNPNYPEDKDEPEEEDPMDAYKAWKEDHMNME